MAVAPRTQRGDLIARPTPRAWSAPPPWAERLSAIEASSRARTVHTRTKGSAGCRRQRAASLLPLTRQRWRSPALRGAPALPRATEARSGRPPATRTASAPVAAPAPTRWRRLAEHASGRRADRGQDAYGGGRPARTRRPPHAKPAPPPHARRLRADPAGRYLRRRGSAGPAAEAETGGRVPRRRGPGRVDRAEAPRHGVLPGPRPALRPGTRLGAVRQRGGVPADIGRPGRRDRRRDRRGDPRVHPARPDGMGRRTPHPSDDRPPTCRDQDRADPRDGLDDLRDAGGHDRGRTGGDQEHQCDHPQPGALRTRDPEGPGVVRQGEHPRRFPQHPAPTSC